MPWVKLDDRFWHTRKIRKAWRTAPATIGLLALSLSYANCELTDGYIDPEWVELQLLEIIDPNDPPALVKAMVECELWAPMMGGWQVHEDYMQHQPKAKEVERVREAKRMAGALGGKRSGETRRAKGT